jgi:hypothetical protein
MVVNEIVVPSGGGLAPAEVHVQRVYEQ